MGRQEIDITVTSAAPPAAVFALLADGASWPAWSPIDSFELERPGTDAPEGVGAVRVLRSGRTEGRDTIVELVPDRRFAYTHVSSLPVKDYRGQVDLEPDGAGTRIRWTASFAPRFPGTGPLVKLGIRRFLSGCAQGLADLAGAARRAGP
jgi:uncharacterized protein YndB with AHSA1/START domain